MNDIHPWSNAHSPAVWRLRVGSSRATDSWCPVKTAEGQAEIRQRHRRLTQRQRTMLLLVDGRRSVAQVKALALQAGATETSFDELLDLGLIAEPPPASPPDEAPKTSFGGLLNLNLMAEPQPASPPDKAPETSFDELLNPSLMAEPQPASPPDKACESSSNGLLNPSLIAEPQPASPAGEAPGFATEAADSAGTVASSLEADADADMFEQFELNAERLLEQSMRTTPWRIDSMVSSLLPFIESALGGNGPDDASITRDNRLEEARRILVREVRNHAPLAGSITVMKLHRARTREELAALFDEVDSAISKPMRHLSARQTLLHVRGLLFGDDVDEPSSPP